MKSKMGNQLLPNSFLKFLHFSNFIKYNEIGSNLYTQFNNIQTFIPFKDDLKMRFHTLDFK